METRLPGEARSVYDCCGVTPMRHWFYFAKGAVVGPLTENELLLAVERGDVDLKTPVYTPEFGAAPENWKRASTRPKRRDRGGEGAP
jgi:hypothetical protein